jgi:hypothetical protein
MWPILIDCPAGEVGIADVEVAGCIDRQRVRFANAAKEFAGWRIAAGRIDRNAVVAKVSYVKVLMGVERECLRILDLGRDEPFGRAAPLSIVCDGASFPAG